MMRKRSIPILLVAIVAWIPAWRIMGALTSAPFGYEMGATYPAPTSVRLLGLFALLSSLLGLSLLVFDFVHWFKRETP